MRHGLQVYVRFLFHHKRADLILVEDTRPAVQTIVLVRLLFRDRALLNIEIVVVTFYGHGTYLIIVVVLACTIIHISQVTLSAIFVLTEISR